MNGSEEDAQGQDRKHTEPTSVLCDLPDTGRDLRVDRTLQLEKLLHQSTSVVYVTVVQVGIVRMFMPQRLMAVPVGMRLRRAQSFMRVLMVLVMHMSVLMFQKLMLMFMLVPFRKVQPHTESHQHSGDYQVRRDCLAENYDGQHRPDEWRDGVVGAG